MFYVVKICFVAGIVTTGFLNIGIKIQHKKATDPVSGSVTLVKQSQKM
jgi:hypothetical protein